MSIAADIQETKKTGMRLQVFMSHAGAASRRTAEEIIAQGRVTVNGSTVTIPGTRVEEGDIVLLDGRQITPESRLLHFALNKPPGFLCSSSDPQGRPLALSLLPKNIKERLYSVGRLDYMSCGLIFFTNDGDFANRLGHPRSELEKEYLVEAAGPISDAAIEAFLDGITIEGEHYKAKLAEKISRNSMRIILIEGKNREIRRVFSHFHLHPVVLRRVRIGPVNLGNLPEGTSRPLTDAELKKLNRGKYGNSN
ncbi:MAG: rRNA pseudouridine synthase [Treponema sp.]|nr:rRNA pseudouridine synthase [Treponema sp.]